MFIGTPCRKLYNQKLNIESAEGLWNIDKKINIDSLCTQNHQELYSPRTHTFKGQSVLQ